MATRDCLNSVLLFGTLPRYRECEDRGIEPAYPTVVTAVQDYMEDEDGDVKLPADEMMDKKADTEDEEKLESEPDEEKERESVPVEDLEDLREKVELIEEFAEGQQSEVAGRIGGMIDDLL